MIFYFIGKTEANYLQSALYILNSYKVILYSGDSTSVVQISGQTFPKANKLCYKGDHSIVEHPLSFIMSP